MKKLLFIPFFCLFTTVFSQTKQVVINYPGYTSYYNPSSLIPDSVIWTVNTHQKIANRETTFHSTGDRPNLKEDYKGSGYDIGHNCDASDENMDGNDEYNSFDWVNTYPQLPHLNRLVWLALENEVRVLSHDSPVKVKVSWQGVKGYLGKDKVTIPLYCIKEIWQKGHYSKYVMPNQDTVVKHPYTFYLVKHN